MRVGKTRGRDEVGVLNRFLKNLTEFEEVLTELEEVLTEFEDF